MTDEVLCGDGLITIRDFIRWGASCFAQSGLFFGHGTANALDDAAQLVLHTLHLPYDLSVEYFGAVLVPVERERVAELVRQRIADRKPVAYLTNEAIFAGLPFYVDERVLVPRSPIAELFERRFDPWIDIDKVSRVLDLCTGSGCIAIACAYAFPNAIVDAVDLSDDALAVASMNVEKHHVEDSVRLIKSDLFCELNGCQYDLIISNPPYVNQKEWQALPKEYHAEPKMGFDGGITGLDCVKRILLNAANHMTDTGIAVIEVGSSAEALQDSYPDVPFMWLDFEHGGDGVFLLSAEQLGGIAAAQAPFSGESINLRK